MGEWGMPQKRAKNVGGPEKRGVKEKSGFLGLGGPKFGNFGRCPPDFGSVSTYKYL